MVRDERMQELQAGSAALVAALDEVQWANLDGDGTAFCPLCDGDKDEGHTSWCAIGTALADDTGREWLADARAVAKALAELRVATECYAGVDEGMDGPLRRSYDALARARARGWLEP